MGEKSKKQGGGAVLHETDEGIRPSTNIAGLAKLKSLKSITSVRVTAFFSWSLR